MGGHAGGDIASAIVAQSVAGLDRSYDNAEEASRALVDGLLAANQKLADTVVDHTELAGMGTTFSGLMVTGDLISAAHIGDSRIYLSNKNGLKQISKDHTFVQRLIDTGRITEEEALTHPRRNVLMRVLGDVELKPEIDTETFKAQVGDRWMICSDGLCGVVPADIIANILANKTSDVEEAAELLVYEALEHGAPDNVTVVVFDVVDESTSVEVAPHFVGSAENEVVIAAHRGRRLVRVFNPRIIRDILVPQPADAEFALESEELLERIMNETRAKVRWRRIRGILLFVVLVAFAGTLLTGAYNYTQTRYYISQDSGSVVIYQGIRESFGPLRFSHIYERTAIKMSDLTSYQQDLVMQSISGDSVADIEAKLELLVAVGK
jgi:protein phosphatase